MKSEFIGFSYTLLLSLLAFIAPVQQLMIAIGTIILIDFVLGVTMARKRGIPITSREAKRTIVKMFLYQLTVLTGFILDTFFIPGDLVVRVCAMAIGLIEAKSIFEKIYGLTGLNVWDLLKEKLHASVSSVGNTSSSSTTTNTSSDGTVTTTNSSKSTVTEAPLNTPSNSDPS